MMLEQSTKIEEQIKTAAPQVRSLIENWQTKYGINLASVSQESAKAMDAALRRGTTPPVRQALFKVLAEQDPSKAIELEIDSYRRKGISISGNVARETHDMTLAQISPEANLAAYKKASAMLKDDAARQTGHAPAKPEQKNEEPQKRAVESQYALILVTAYARNKQVEELDKKRQERWAELKQEHFPRGFDTSSKEDLITLEGIRHNDPVSQKLEKQIEIVHNSIGLTIESAGISLDYLYSRHNQNEMPPMETTKALIMAPLVMDAVRDAVKHNDPTIVPMIKHIVRSETKLVDNFKKILEKDVSAYIKDPTVNGDLNKMDQLELFFKDHESFTTWKESFDQNFGKKT